MNATVSEDEVPLKLLLLGTGDFARPAFAALADGPHGIVGLVTQPDRSGAGHHNHPHPMKDEFLGRGVPVLQPPDVNSPETLDRLVALDADLAVVAAYGQILRPELLSIPRLGAINLHASLLPRHRGATPIQHAILAGDSRTGVSIFQIEPAVDTGPLLGTVCTTISDDETSGELHDRLAQLAVDLAVDVVEQLASGTTRPLQQDDSLATRAPRLVKSDAAIDWSCDATTLDLSLFMSSIEDEATVQLISACAMLGLPLPSSGTRGSGGGGGAAASSWAASSPSWAARCRGSPRATWWRRCPRRADSAAAPAARS